MDALDQSTLHREVPTTAPMATGWSDSGQVGLNSHRKIAPFHGARNFRLTETTKTIHARW
jgi:hypothetical protein